VTFEDVWVGDNGRTTNWFLNPTYLPTYLPTTTITTVHKRIDSCSILRRTRRRWIRRARWMVRIQEEAGELEEYGEWAAKQNTKVFILLLLLLWHRTGNPNHFVSFLQISKLILRAASNISTEFRFAILHPHIPHPSTYTLLTRLLQPSDRGTV
jgi:hypothetical protein